MRTQEEIVSVLKEWSEEKGLFDFRLNTLIVFLDQEHAEQLKGIVLKDECDTSDWEQEEFSEDYVISEMQSYMEFAWEKASNHRGLSAGRSVQRFEAWCWLLGNDKLTEILRNSQYAQYGAPMLASVCKEYGFSIPDREDITRMIQGLPCTPGCEEGCGKSIF